VLRPPTVPPSFFIVLSALSVENRTTLSDIASPLGGAQVLHHDFVPDKATHLVSGGNKRTVKLLQALAKGIWVLKSDWIYDSMEAGKWLPEEGYEAVDWFPGAKASRLARGESTLYFICFLLIFVLWYVFAAHQKKGLLHQIAIMVCGGVRVPLHSLERAIELAGGQCTKSYRNTDYCIVAENAIYKPWVEKFPKERAVPIVKEDVHILPLCLLSFPVLIVLCVWGHAVAPGQPEGVQASPRGELPHIN